MNPIHLLLQQQLGVLAKAESAADPIRKVVFFRPSLLGWRPLLIASRLGLCMFVDDRTATCASWKPKLV